MKKYILLTFVFAFTLGSYAKRVVYKQPASRTVVIQKAPRNHKIVVIKGKRYYKWNGNHYRKTHKGYVLVRV